MSGGLAVRDFDERAAYDKWREAHPVLAASLPTVETARGFHVYLLGDGHRTTFLDDGELRGEGSYVLAPPSVHPDGSVYRWIVPLQLSGGVTERTESTEGTEPTETLVCPLVPLGYTLEVAVLRTQPTSGGQRHRRLFELARELKALSETADAELFALRPIVKRWHSLALPTIDTKSLDDSWFDFCEAWQRVRIPKGREPVRQALERASAMPLPREAEQYESTGVRLLVGLSAELQRIAGEGPFYLAVRTVANQHRDCEPVASRPGARRRA